MGEGEGGGDQENFVPHGFLLCINGRKEPTKYVGLKLRLGKYLMTYEDGNPKRQAIDDLLNRKLGRRFKYCYLRLKELGDINIHFYDLLENIKTGAIKIRSQLLAPAYVQ
jgi:hypothetical protein